MIKNRASLKIITQRKNPIVLRNFADINQKEIKIKKSLRKKKKNIIVKLCWCVEKFNR
jgi:hypothetical protein